MANKKIWSYGLDEFGNYFTNNSGQNRMFFIWEALRMRNNNPEEYEGIQFISTQKDLSRRKKMTCVKLGFFRYIENVGGNNYTGDGESLAHSIAILALSQLNTINFIIQNSTVVFNFTELRTENVKIQFPNGNYYYPDLIGIFTKPNSFADKWGGKVAIEVKVKHGCEPIKIKDFKDHNIPIIEITLNENMLFLKELKNEPFNETDLENYYNFLSNKFMEKVYGKILSDPQTLNYSMLEKSRLCEKIETLEMEVKTVKSSYIDRVAQIQLLNNQLQGKVLKIEALNKQINMVTNKNFFEKLVDLFK